MISHQKNVSSNWIRYVLPSFSYLIWTLHYAFFCIFNPWAFLKSFVYLQQEITLLSHLSHPNIVQYYGSELVRLIIFKKSSKFYSRGKMVILISCGYFQGEETLSVYLEYVSGGSIHKLLQEYGPFREPVIQNYTRQVLCGLAYLHGRNTVHR